MPQNVSNTQTGQDNVGGETYDGGRGLVYQYAPQSQQIHWDSTTNGHTVGRNRNTTHDYNNTGASGDTYAMSTLAGGVNNSILPPGLVHPHQGRFESSQSTHPLAPYSNVYGTSAPGTNRRPVVSIVTDHDQQAMGIPQHQVLVLSGDGSGNTSPSSYYGSYQSGQMPGHDNQLQVWSPGSSPTLPVPPRSTSPLKVVSQRPRRGSQRHLNSQYTDPLLLQKYPEERHCALRLAMQFREDQGFGTSIPNDIIDELLEGPEDGKFYCFCCPRARKLRTITPARDHVRKSLGNYPFKCLNPWCRHSSLRSADLTKHMKTCINTAASQ